MSPPRTTRTAAGKGRPGAPIGPGMSGPHCNGAAAVQLLLLADAPGGGADNGDSALGSSTSSFAR
eukprot:6416378-Lingulodinium_polyedra.AAC.1